VGIITKHLSILPLEGQTRLCLDPWAKAFIRADGQVCLCCYSPAVGTIGDQTLHEILNSEQATAYRRGLLSGLLLQPCIHCPEKPVTEIAELVKLVQHYQDTGEY